MKNLMSFFAIVTILFLTSCSKEELVQPQTDTSTVSELVVGKNIQATNRISNPNDFNTSSVEGENEIPITKITSSVGESLLVVDFSSSYNFIDKDLESTQVLDFTDANNNVNTLTFSVYGYNGGDGYLQVSYLIGGNDLSGLDLGSSQIIVEELVIN